VNIERKKEMSKRRPRVEVEKNYKREGKSAARVAKKASKTDLILAKAELANAKASKRKALFALIAIGLVAYLVLSSGAGAGILDKIKTFIPIGE